MNSHRVSGCLITFDPTLTRATFVRKILPDRDIANIVYGKPHGRIGRVVSSTPIPGTMTTS